MGRVTKEQLERYKSIIRKFGDSTVGLNYGELDLLNAIDQYYENSNLQLSGLDVFEAFDESMEKVKKAYMDSKGLKIDSVQEMYIKYPLMEKFLTDFFAAQEGEIGSNMKAVSMLYFWASHNPDLYTRPISINTKRSYHPNVGDTKDWLSFTDSIYSLAGGKLRPYERERKKILPLYGEGDTSAKVLKDHNMAVLMVGKVIKQVEHCDNYMEKSKYLFNEYQYALDTMNILDMDTELENAPNKGDFYLWFDLVDSAKNFVESGDTTQFQENKQKVFKTYNTSMKK